MRSIFEEPIVLNKTFASAVFNLALAAIFFARTFSFGAEEVLGNRFADTDEYMTLAVTFFNPKPSQKKSPEAYRLDMHIE